MKLAALTLACLFVPLSVRAAAQGAKQGQEQEQEQEHEKERARVELRVVLVRPEGRVVVDRGSSDGLAVGDSVVLLPRAGGTFPGTVVEVDDRSALVQLQGSGFVPENGTRGEVLVPASRLAPKGPAQPPAPEPPEPLPWTNKDEGWTSDQPLLAQARAMRPEERILQVTGRVYLIGDATFTSLSGRHDSFLRAGTDLSFENPFGRGGELHFDAEANHRTTALPDQTNENEARLRIDRFSYRTGGTRFDTTRQEFGRFLQYGMPEFGVLDGYEWTHELGSNSRYGASLGFMPEPTPDFHSFEDFQAAAYWDGTFGRERRLHLAAGYQKTLHHWSADRDLFVARVDYLPPTGWTYRGTAWVDYYDSTDHAKGQGLELTRLQAYASRLWREDGVDVALIHYRFPEIERFEFLPLSAKDIARNRADRLSVNGWHELSPITKLHGQVGGWNDQDESGGDVEAGLEVRHLFLRDSRTDLTAFASIGEFSRVAAAQITYGRYGERGGWDVFYEASDHVADGFAGPRGQVYQNRLRGTRTYTTRSGWNLSVYGEALLWDQESSWSAGFYVEKSF